MTEHIRIKAITEFRGDVPNVPVREGVDFNALVNGDEDPFFLTLEVGRANVVSSNNLLFDDEMVDTIVHQINTRGVEGIMGHLRFEDLDSAYPVSDVHWIGAIRQGDKAWAKGYIPKTAVAQREHFRIIKASNGKAATSIFGLARLEQLDGGINKAHDFQLEQLDLAPYTRAALPPDSDFTITKEIKMGDEVTKVSVETSRIAELEASLAEQASLIAMMEGEALESRVAEVTRTTVADLKLEEDANEAMLTVLREMVHVSQMDEVDEAIAKAWDTLKPLVELVRTAQAGVSAISQATDTKSRVKQIDDSPATRAAARARLGV